PVNTVNDEFAPVLSPNYSNKLYLSSARFDTQGGKRDEFGREDNQYGKYRTDIYSTYETNGQWSVPEPLPGLLNSAMHDMVFDFAQGGQVLVFYKTNDLLTGEILVDTFGRDDQSLFPETFAGPIGNNDNEDQALFLINDSTLLFSSRREEGFGGLDLYISRKSNNGWGLPKNLGPRVNSIYDESFPFLARDGRSLYFSSNRPESMGGYDVFLIRYYDQQETWSLPENLAFPINSPGDEINFRISDDGLKAFFSSKRPGGYGGMDIYLAYFKKARQEHLVRSLPVLYEDVPAYRRKMREEGSFLTQRNEANLSTTPSGTVPVNVTYKFRPLYVGNNDQVESPGNLQMLEKISELLIANPQLKLVITGHGDGKSPGDFELYFSIKRAEKVSKYLTENGVSNNRLLVRGVGVQYPFLQINRESGPQINVDKFNRRIEYAFVGLEGSGIKIDMEEHNLRESLKDPKRFQLAEDESGLYYRLQVAELRQNFTGLQRYNELPWLVERAADNSSYRYLVGRMGTYREAEALRNEVMAAGQTGAFVVPYFNGYRLKRSEIFRLSTDFPDLQYYLGAN
ncbi:MAG: OmpA family protein, partial [Saprospiraceae bacterium]|nr:OmpA family protein [Saprospiraceae bacterium]